MKNFSLLDSVHLLDLFSCFCAPSGTNFRVRVSWVPRLMELSERLRVESGAEILPVGAVALSSLSSYGGMAALCFLFLFF